MIECIIFIIIGICILIYIGISKIVSMAAGKTDKTSRNIPVSFSLQSKHEQPLTAVNGILPDNSKSGYIDNYWISSESTQRKVTAHLSIKYQKTNGQIHKRIFDVLSFSRGEKGYYINGYCHNRCQNITLSSLGIIEAIDLDTNKYIKNIINYLEDRYGLSPEKAKDSLFDNYGLPFYILVYLAATSGRIVKDERTIIAAFIKTLPSLNDIDDQWIIQTIRGAYRPGKREIRNWVKAAASKGADLNLVINHIDQLSKLPKNENREFQTFRNYIQKQIALKTGETIQKVVAVPTAEPERITPMISSGNDELRG